MRTAGQNRKTNETDIALELCLDGTGSHSIDTGIGFFDHMLTLFAVHGNFDLRLKCTGDINVDGHHTVEDIGIILGRCIAAALGDKKGIQRYAAVSIPMDESLASVCIDVSGRPYFVYNAPRLSNAFSSDFDYQLVEEFFRAVATNGGLTLHINLLYGGNYHHMAESIFKAFARALKEAVKIVGDSIPSSKGVLD
ncbi:MAG: imidazoleglycerol-phosphate dehydratase HisB [Clostridia bacterium]|nr:imidazoleglycerol-phosphate dehydratase HisB [Clostridia bacterium]